MSKSSHELSHIENATIGAITGFTEALVTNPFFIIKTNLQQKKPVPWHVKGLYTGFAANAAGFIPTVAIQVGSHRWIEQHFFGNKPDYFQNGLAAFTSGVLSSFIGCPTERIMNLQNNSPKEPLIRVIKKQVITQGVSSLFVGQGPTAIREGFFALFFLSVTPLLKNALQPYVKNEEAASIVAGVASGCGATVVTQPVDTLKTIQQSSQRRGPGFFQIVTTLKGRDYFKGTISRSLAVIISITLMSSVKEKLENQCQHYHEMHL